MRGIALSESGAAPSYKARTPLMRRGLASRKGTDVVTITNRLKLPQPIVDAIRNDGYSKGGSDYSVTELIAPAQQRYLMAKHESELVEDAADRIWALLGQTMHTILERANATGIAEKRLFTTIDGATVSGQFDHMDLYRDENGLIILRDWKLASVWEYVRGVREEREQQTNLLAWLARRNGYDVDALEIVMIFRDWSKPEAMRYANDDSFPNEQVARIKMPMWSQAKCEEFALQRVRLHRDAWKVRPLCSDEERWAQPDTFAVKRTKNKRALRVLKTEEDALKWAADNKAGFRTRSLDGEEVIQLAKDVIIEHRKGTSQRCAAYCSVLQFCEQGRQIVGVNAEESAQEGNIDG